MDFIQQEKDYQFFIDRGSRILHYPESRSDVFSFECIHCKGEATYLSVSTFIRRGQTPLCKVCQEKNRSLQKIEKHRQKVISLLRAKNSELIEYTKEINPITLTCASCQNPFTYSTYNNLKKRNPDYLCTPCIEQVRDKCRKNKAKNCITAQLSEYLKKNKLQILEPFPVKKSASFIITCSRCQTPHKMPCLNTFLFNIRKNPGLLPVCNKCKAFKIGETQRNNNHPGFLKQLRAFFKRHGSKLLNAPQNSKRWIEFICNRCGAKSLRKGFEFFRKYQKIICVRCSVEEAGLKRRMAVPLEAKNQEVPGKRVKRHKTGWLNKVRSRWGKICVISGQKRKVIAHHIYSYTRYPVLSERLLNGVLLRDDLHKEYHRVYGRMAANYFDFQNFYRDKTGKDFFLVQSKDTIVDIVSESCNIYALKQEYFQKGINYIPIWEFELFKNPKILESIFLQKVEKTQVTIFARNCKIVEISDILAKDFFQTNHRQGYVPAQKNIALFHDLFGLVAVMSFGKPRFTEKYQYELFRFCSLLNKNIPGAASKLFKYFISKYMPESVITYCDIRFASLNPQQTVYSKMGFTYSHATKPNYYYCKDGQIYSRIKFQKHKLQESPLISCFDPDKTEIANMRDNGFSILKDCGNHVFIYRIDKGG